MPYTNDLGVPDAGFMFAKLIYDIGSVLVADDYHDYGKFDHVHHWFIGEVFRQVGKHLGGALVGLSVMNEMGKQIIKVFPLTTGDEAKLDNIIKQCLRRNQPCHT